jgi:hypothetical protein
MSILREVLKDLTGDVHFYVTVGDSPAAEVKLRGKEILVEIKNPLLAMEAVIKQLLSKPKNKIRLQKLKTLGYRIRIKYKLLEVDL